MTKWYIVFRITYLRLLHPYTVAGPGFDLRGAWTLSTGRGGRKSSESVVG